LASAKILLGNAREGGVFDLLSPPVLPSVSTPSTKARGVVYVAQPVCQHFASVAGWAEWAFNPAVELRWSDDALHLRAIVSGVPAEDRKATVHGRSYVSRVKAGGLRSRTRKRRHLVRVGYDPRYGARPLKRAIQKQIETPLAKRLVAGEIRNGEGVYVDVDENGALKFVSAAEEELAR
jgi:hypothetical protein